MAVKGKNVRKKTLVIVESPTKAKTIGKYLGPSYKVMASVGHIRDLPKSKLGIDIENDFESCLKCFEKWYGRREDAYMANETGIHRNKAWIFDVFAPDAGGYAGVALRFIDIVESGKAGSMILCAPNQGAIPGLRDNDIVEITCDIAPDSCTPHKVTDGDERALELIRRVKAYERLASKAIREKSRTAAIDCLTLHPLVNSYSLAVKLVDSYIALNAGYSDGWK